MTKRTVLIGFTVAVALAIAVLARGAVAKRGSAALTDARVERGRYLVTTLGCNDCHTPWKMGAEGPEPDMGRMLSGHPEELVMPPAPALGDGPWVMVAAGTNTAWAGPWGVSFTANLTPDENTGIGIWTEDIFMNTIRNGRHWGVARPLLPPMPWQAYRELTDEDLKSVYAYLRTIPPIHNRVPQPLLPGEPAPVPAG